MVFCVGGDKYPRNNTPLECPEGKNAEDWQYSVSYRCIAEEKPEQKIKRCYVVAFALSVVGSVGFYFNDALVETKQQFVQNKRLGTDPKGKRERSLSKVQAENRLSNQSRV